MTWGLRVSLALGIGLRDHCEGIVLAVLPEMRDNTLDILSTSDRSATVVQNSDHNFNAHAGRPKV